MKYGIEKLLLLSATGIIVLVSTQTVEAQLIKRPVRELAKDLSETRRDYVLDKPYQYQPGDPWYRGKVTRLHTGHYGKFYNCDAEECKRNSPYITWNVHHERDLPRKRRLIDCLACELDEVRRRVANGSCRAHEIPQCPSGGAEGCGCSSCDYSTHGYAAASQEDMAVERTATYEQPTQRAENGSSDASSVRAEMTNLDQPSGLMRMRQTFSERRELSQRPRDSRSPVAKPSKPAGNAGGLIKYVKEFNAKK